MSKPELIDTGTDKRFARRDDEGKFKESDDAGARSVMTSANAQRPRSSPARATAATADPASRAA